jgi:methionine-rich copper-binding protein CopC
MKLDTWSALSAKCARPLLYLVPFVILILGVPSTASAHAILVSSNPNNGAVVAGPNLAVLLSFNSRIDRSRSRLTIDGPEGQGAVVSIEDSDQRPAILSARLSGLKAGTYTLHWQVLAADGHITRGIISFRIK